MHRFRHSAMATQFEIRCTHPDEEHARQAARFAFEAADRLERQFSRFVENSDVTRINHLRAGEETRVSYETMQCLQLAGLAHEQTAGAFDISVGTGFENVELVPREFLVRLHGEGVSLDLGAIGKGYALDRMVEILEEWDVTEALLDAGCSSVVALSPPSGCGDWSLTLSVPRDENREVLVGMSARQMALGASGIRKEDHIRDPKTGRPVRDRKAAWVVGTRNVLGDIGRQAGVEPSPAALADALSTAFMVMRPEEIEKYCRTADGVEAWILETGLTHFSYAQGSIVSKQPER
jgi:FAD:protein FMN transferase